MSSEVRSADWHGITCSTVLGLARLGHDVFFLEDSDDYASCYDPVRNVMGRDPTYGLNFAGRAFLGLGLESRWTYTTCTRTAGSVQRPRRRWTSAARRTCC